jgi:uncharacterized protein YecE (DUF72 family)
MSWLRIGTCSWKYNSWRGLIYPNKRYLNYLKEYAKVYNTVEVDQWFWSLFGTDKISLPIPNVVEEYKLSVPDEFVFTIKMPNSLTLTHFYRKVKNEPLQINPYLFSNKLLNQFLATIEPLNNQLGSLMYQFEYLNKQKMSSQFEFQKQFEAFLKNSPSGYPYAIEIRNPNYLNKHFFDFLNQNNLQFVFLQGYYMPSILDIYDKFRDRIRGTSVIRLHGGDRQEIEEKSGGQWNQILEPKDKELEQVVDMVRDLLTRQVNVFLNVNNHYEGSAPVTIRKFREMMGQTGV